MTMTKRQLAVVLLAVAATAALAIPEAARDVGLVAAAQAQSHGGGQQPQGPQGQAGQQGPRGSSGGGGQGSDSGQQGQGGSSAQSGDANQGGQSLGAGSVFQRKFNYWGGRNRTDGGGSGDDSGDDGTGTLPSTSADDATGGSVPGGGGGADITNAAAASYEKRCASYGAGVVEFDDRFAGDNLSRLYVAGAFLAPTVTQEKLDVSGSPLLNLAYYQATLDGKHPDLLVAGTFLGLVAERPVDEGVVETANRVLCLSLTKDGTRTVASIAEQQREYSQAQRSTKRGQ